MKELDLSIREIEDLRNQLYSVEKSLAVIFFGQSQKYNLTANLDDIDVKKIDEIEVYGINPIEEGGCVQVKTTLSDAWFSLSLPKDVIAELIKGKIEYLIGRRKELINELSKYKIIKS